MQLKYTPKMVILYCAGHRKPAKRGFLGGGCIHIYIYTYICISILCIPVQIKVLLMVSGAARYGTRPGGLRLYKSVSFFASLASDLLPGFSLVILIVVAIVMAAASSECHISSHSSRTSQAAMIIDTAKVTVLNYHSTCIALVTVIVREVIISHRHCPASVNLPTS